MLQLIRKVAGRPVARRARRLARAFLEDTQRTEEVQRRRLLELIQRHAESQFGRDHHFREIRSPADFRRHVPIRGYDGHEPYIDRVRKGDIRALFGPGTEVLMFALTSGTTARPKTIPVTRESLQNYRAGWTIWGILAFDAHPEILEEGLRPLLQLVSNWRETTTEGGIPCGAITGLTSQMQNPLVRQVYCMPPATMAIKDIESKYYVALRMTVHKNLGAIMAANPSTILAIARLGDRERETLIRDLHDGTIASKWDVPAEVRRALRRRSRRQPAAARRLEETVERTGRLLPRDYWPDLCFLGNWTGGVMGAYLKQYPDVFGERPVRDLGLIASEGRFTIPIEDATPGGVLDVRHHYFEFIPEDQIDRAEPETVEAHELIEGRAYYLLPTTAGGLYRYHIHDLVRCAGFHGRAPIIEFLNKGAHFSSLTGEKLSEFQVVEAVRGAQSVLGLNLKSFLLLPSWGDPPCYHLLVEEDDLGADSRLDDRLASEVDARLYRLNVEYENKRETLRLGPIRIRRIEPGSWVEFQKRRLQRSGGTVEQYKQPCLLSDLEAASGFRYCKEVPVSTAGGPPQDREPGR